MWVVLVRMHAWGLRENISIVVNLLELLEVNIIVLHVKRYCRSTVRSRSIIPANHLELTQGRDSLLLCYLILICIKHLLMLLIKDVFAI